MTPTVPLRRVIAHARDPLYRDAYALVASNLMTSGLGLVYWGLAARLYAPDDLGRDAALISTMLFLSNLAQLNMRVALLRFVPETGAYTARFVAVCFLASGIAAVVASAAFVAIVAAFRSSFPSLEGVLDGGFAAWFIVATVLWSFFTLQDGLLTGLRKAVVVPVENAFYSVVKIGLLVGFAVAVDRYPIFLSWTIPTVLLVVVVTGAAFLRLIPRHAAKTTGRTAAMEPRRLVGFLALDYLASLFATLSVSLLPILVVTYTGAEASAYFYIAWLIVTSLQLVPNYLAASLTVEMVGDMAGFVRHARRALVHMLRLFVPIVVGLVVAAPLVLLVFGDDYARNGSDLLRLASLGLLPYALNILFIGIARVQRRGRVIVVVQAAIAALTLGGTAVLLPRLGITGVGIAWLTAQLIVGAVVAVFGLRPLLRHRAGAAAA